jgi:aminoglycoside/choline kinase family phosphotransferase
LQRMKSTPEGDPDLARFVAGYLKDMGREVVFQMRSLAGDGSKRRFWRILIPSSGITYVAMRNAPVNQAAVRENRAYLQVGEHLLARAVPVPRLYRADPEGGFFVMEDFGDGNLQGRSREGDPVPLYRIVLRLLLHMQIAGAEGFRPEWTCQTERYDRGVMLRYEANYFRDAFLGRYLGLKPDWPELEPPFDRIAEKASRAPGHFFLHRDFQSRNIMVQGERIGIIDWQGGRFGPLGYDVASLLIDPYTDLTPLQREGLRRFYLELLRERGPAWADPFEESYPFLALQRNLQILGAFAYLSTVGGKPYFEAYIPKALQSLRSLLEGVSEPELAPLLDLVVKIEGEKVRR